MRAVWTYHLPLFYMDLVHVLDWCWWSRMVRYMFDVLQGAHGVVL